MDNNISSPNQPTSTNQPPQGVQIPVSNTTQPFVQPTQTTPTSFQQPSMNPQSEVVQSSEGGNTKSGKRKILLILGGLIVLLVLAIMGMFVLLTPIVRGLSACIEENSKNMDALFQRGIAEKWNNQQKCANFKPASEKLITCYESVGDSSLLPEQLAFTLGGLINSSVKNVDRGSIIELHNTNCSQYPETLIGNNASAIISDQPINANEQEIVSDLSDMYPKLSFKVLSGEHNPPLTFGETTISTFITVELSSEESVTSEQIAEVGKQVCTTLERLQLSVSQVQVETVSTKAVFSSARGISGTCDEYNSGVILNTLQTMQQ